MVLYLSRVAAVSVFLVRTTKVHMQISITGGTTAAEVASEGIAGAEVAACCIAITTPALAPLAPLAEGCCSKTATRAICAWWRTGVGWKGGRAVQVGAASAASAT